MTKTYEFVTYACWLQPVAEVTMDWLSGKRNNNLTSQPPEFAKVDAQTPAHPSGIQVMFL